MNQFGPQPDRSSRVSVSIPDKLSDWDAAGLVPAPRNEHEEADAVSRMESVLGQMLNQGRLLPLSELPVLVGRFCEDDLRGLAYRDITESDRKRAYATIDERARSISERFIGHLVVSCVHEAQTPTSVDWSDLRGEFVSNWRDVKRELLSDSEETRRVARRCVEMALDRVRLPTSIRGDFTVVPDSLRSSVEEVLGWSRQIRDSNP